MSHILIHSKEAILNKMLPPICYRRRAATAERLVLRSDRPTVGAVECGQISRGSMRNSCPAPVGASSTTAPAVLFFKNLKGMQLSTPAQNQKKRYDYAYGFEQKSFMFYKQFISALTLAMIALPAFSEPHIDDQNALAMYTALREACAETIPERKDYFLNSRYSFESVNFHRLAPLRKDPEYLDLLKKYREEVRQPANALDAANCIGLAKGTGMMQLISVQTSKPMPPINVPLP